MANTKTGPPLAPWTPLYGSSRSTFPDGAGRRRGDPLGDDEPYNCSWEPSRHTQAEGVVKRRKKV